MALNVVVRNSVVLMELSLRRGELLGKVQAAAPELKVRVTSFVLVRWMVRSFATESTEDSERGEKWHRQSVCARCGYQPKTHRLAEQNYRLMIVDL